MKIVDKYIFKNFILIFSFCLFFLYVLFVIGDIFGFLDEILREGITVSALAHFYLYMLPLVIIQIAPVSCLLACVFLLGNLNMHNEITALKASGISLLKILRPMILATLLIGTGIFLVNDKLVPGAARMVNKIRYEKLEVGKRGSSKVLKNIAMYAQGNKIIFARTFNFDKNVLEDVIIHEESARGDIISKMSIARMTWTGKGWKGEDIVVYTINSTGEFIGSPEVYTEKMIDLKQTPLDFLNNQWQPQYMSFSQLKKYLYVFLAGSKVAHRRFSVDLYYKLAFPFSALAMILIAAPFTLVTKRGGALIGVARGIVVGLAYIPLVAVGLALGRGGVIQPLYAAWFANIALGGIGLYYSITK